VERLQDCCGEGYGGSNAAEWSVEGGPFRDRYEEVLAIKVLKEVLHVIRSYGMYMGHMKLVQLLQRITGFRLSGIKASDNARPCTQYFSRVDACVDQDPRIHSGSERQGTADLAAVSDSSVLFLIGTKHPDRGVQRRIANLVPSPIHLVCEERCGVDRGTTVTSSIVECLSLSGYLNRAYIGLYLLCGGMILCAWTPPT
jgi:hypothetical protein